MQKDHTITSLLSSSSKRTDITRFEDAAKLASLLFSHAEEKKTKKEKILDNIASFFFRDRTLKSFLLHLFDTAFRSRSKKRTFDQIHYLVKRYQVLEKMPKRYKMLVRMAFFTCRLFPRTSVSLMKKALLFQMSQVIVPAEPKKMKKKLETLKKEKIAINLNRLGEAILGEKEANKRVDEVLEDLENPLIQTVSVKISSIFCHVTPVSFTHTVQEVKKALSKLLLKAKKEEKTVMLDMEEYKDLELTVAVFKEILSEDAYHDVSCGLALQAYLPDSFAILESLTSWAKKTRSKPIYIRLVKGANLSMERVEASLKEWPQAPFQTKAEVDAHFKKMLDFAFRKENIEAVQIGVASHNLFDISYALLLAHERGVSNSVTFEMLSGMAPHMQRAVHDVVDKMLLYCPVVKKESFHTAMAYLMRRLDENTAPENFLTHLFDLKVKSKAWNEQEEAFCSSVLYKESVSSTSQRRQTIKSYPHHLSLNTPDTDWTQKENRDRIEEILSWKTRFTEIPIVVDGQEIETDSKKDGFDPSNLLKACYRYSTATKQELEFALKCAETEARKCKASTLQERIFLLKQAAYAIEKERVAITGAMMQDSAKTLYEADIEVSEAVDFALYYAKELEHAHFGNKAHATGKVSLVAPPWNFPCAIPISGILSSIAAGHAVLFKPAPEAVLVGWTIAKCLWQAGISKKLLQFIPTIDDIGGSFLIKDSRVDVVILTGATQTARLFLSMRPKLRLLAETGGKNALIVSSLADQDLAIRDIIYSAFSYSGQKCSACSQAIIDQELYYDKTFRSQLQDAAESLIVGSQWDLETQVVPLIHPPEKELSWALSTLEKGQKWLVEPKGEKNLFSPGIAIDVKPMSRRHQTEFFGPVLSLIPAIDLSSAIEIANSTPYGLTSGIHSLDPREIEEWKKTITAGNCYINRTITGAIVGRQPFGGTKASSFGPGMKVGGPNYLLQFLKKDTVLPNEIVHVPKMYESSFSELLSKEDNALFQEAIHSYLLWQRQYFCKKQVMRNLIGQDNELYFVPKEPLLLFHTKGDSLLDTFLIVVCATLAGASFTFATNSDNIWLKTILQERDIPVIDHKELLPFLQTKKSWHIRGLSYPDDAFLHDIMQHANSFEIEPPSRHGRLEMIHYLREVSISFDYHRYGNLMDRSYEGYKEVL